MKHLLPKFKERFDYWRNLHDKYYGWMFFKAYNESWTNMHRLKRAIKYIKNRKNV